jgi:6-phosphofructo-2-kinase/fructose-2,6-biphosphatase 2
VGSGVKEDHSASYFSHSNEEATRLREQLSADSLEMLISWLKEGGNVGIHGTRHALTTPGARS